MIKHESEKNCERLINTREEANFDLARSCIIHKIRTANVIAKSSNIPTVIFPGDFPRISVILKNKYHIAAGDANILAQYIYI